MVDSNVKKVQHPTGGVVGEIRVRDGARVKAGDVVLRLDATVTQANVAIIAKSLQELTVRRARLLAEQSGAAAITFPEALIAAAGDPDVAVLIAGERRVFEARRAARDGQKAQLRERVGQLQEQIQGLKEQVAAKDREIALIKEELVGVRELWSKNLVQVQRVMALDRDAARLDGERGALISSSAQTKGRITETELQIIQAHKCTRFGSVAYNMTFSIDLQLPGMLNAAVMQSPVFGGKLVSYDESKIAKMRGVKGVVKINDSTLAVVADTFWRAKTALYLRPIC